MRNHERTIMRNNTEPTNNEKYEKQYRTKT